MKYSACISNEIILDPLIHLLHRLRFQSPFATPQPARPFRPKLQRGAREPPTGPGSLPAPAGGRRSLTSKNRGYTARFRLPIVEYCIGRGRGAMLPETERMFFRVHQPGDLEAYCAMEMDPDVRRFVGGQPRTRAEAEKRFYGALGDAPFEKLRLWATILKSDGRYIGRCGIYPHFGEAGPVAGEGSIAFYLAREFWGRGLATEAGAAFVQFGFVELKLWRIVATIQQGNDASVRVMEKLGFERYRIEQGERRVFLHFHRRAPVVKGTG
ncbi:MAG TPA: GNAT family N-acetyltransferase [Chthonomonadales bacterium]|nr:GNAT family N-acetyltransferase [Chthonomonadales bacterium]